MEFKTGPGTRVIIATQCPVPKRLILQITNHDAELVRDSLKYMYSEKMQLHVYRAEAAAKLASNADHTSCSVQRSLQLVRSHFYLSQDFIIIEHVYSPTRQKDRQRQIICSGIKHIVKSNYTL